MKRDDSESAEPRGTAPRAMSIAPLTVTTRTIVATAVVLVAAACSKGDRTSTAFDAGIARPDTYPIMLNKVMPFRYPPALYAEKMQGNVTLRLYVEKDGSVIEDSTHVVESSKIPALDSAAIKGSRELKFEPAKLRGTAMPVSILFPVYFRHPDASPPPGDSVLKRQADTAAKPTKP